MLLPAKVLEMSQKKAGKIIWLILLTLELASALHTIERNCSTPSSFIYNTYLENKP